MDSQDNYQIMMEFSRFLRTFRPSKKATMDFFKNQFPPSKNESTVSSKINVTRMQHILNNYKNYLKKLEKEIKQVKEENLKLNHKILSLEIENKTLRNETKQYNDHKLITQSQFSINNLHNQSISSLLKLKDNRIVSGSEDGAILICSIDYFKQTWNKNVFKEDAHNGTIFSFCELNENKLISCSSDKTIKLWKYSDNDLLNISTLTSHLSWVRNVIQIDNKHWSSCSDDGKIIIYESNEPFNEVKILQEESEVMGMIKLNKKDTLISSCRNSTLNYWNLKEHIKEHTMEKLRISYSSHLIELSNGYLALSSCEAPYPIIFIDPFDFKIIKSISTQGYIISNSSICEGGLDNLMYICEENFVEISINDYYVKFQTNNVKGCDGKCGMLSIKNGNFVLVTNKINGYEIIDINSLYINEK